MVDVMLLETVQMVDIGISALEKIYFVSLLMLFVYSMHIRVQP